MLHTYSIEYYNSSDTKRSKMGPKYDPSNLTLDEYDYSERYEELDDLRQLEDDEEKYYSVPSTPISKGYKKEEGNRFKILTPNKLLTRLPILLAQIKAGNNSNKLKKNQANGISFVSA